MTLARPTTAADLQHQGFRALPGAARVYLAAVLAAAAGGTVAASLATSHGETDLGLLAVVALFCAGGNLFEIFMPGHWSFQPNMLFFFAGAILLPPWAIALLAVACFLPGYIANRRDRPESFPWYKVAFNIANYLLAGLAAHELANVGGTVPAMADSELGAVVVLAAAAVGFAAINHVLIVVAVWQAGERSLRNAARQLREGFPLDTALCLTGACFAVLWDVAPALVILSPGPALLVHRALRTPLLARRAEELRDDVGVLQAALLPSVPPRLGGLSLSVAYRPAEGPGAGGDFYDVLELEGGRVAILLGDVSGHGRDALGRSALMRYTLRAYLDAGLGPSAALRVAGGALHNELGDDFATVVLAVHDPRQGTLTYASAGHPPPIVLAEGVRQPLTDCSAPPIGVGVPTGVRQSTIPAPAGALICFYTDGVTDARVEGEAVGLDGLTRRLTRAGHVPSAEALIGRLARHGDAARDDMAVCLVQVVEGPRRAAAHVEELHCSPAELAGGLPERFLRACGVAAEEAAAALGPARAEAAESGRGVLLRVRLDAAHPRPEVLAEPRDTGDPLRRRRTRRQTDIPQMDEIRAMLGVER